MNSKLKANKGCVLVFSFEKWSFYTRAYFMTAIKIKLEKVLSTVNAQSYFQLSLCSMLKVIFSCLYVQCRKVQEAWIQMGALSLDIHCYIKTQPIPKSWSIISVFSQGRHF
jgi:hypothetical protein